ncbi:MAG: superinfection immunity protein [Gammaproteobacteria bacterium]|jgi:hypothetical protein|nr:superinfection immunity protein [Gammaproteobacteria bacterium]
MLGFELTIWDYLTFATALASAIAVIVILLWIAGLPGQIAIARKHPEAEAVKIMGYAGFLTVVPWIQAFIWAFKPTDVVDIRRFPAEEARATEEDIARLKGAADKEKTQAPAGEKPVPDNDTTR